jgi:hypothetical protein
VTCCTTGMMWCRYRRSTARCRCWRMGLRCRRRATHVRSRFSSSRARSRSLPCQHRGCSPTRHEEWFRLRVLQHYAVLTFGKCHPRLTCAQQLCEQGAAPAPALQRVFLAAQVVDAVLKLLVQVLEPGRQTGVDTMQAFTVQAATATDGGRMKKQRHRGQMDSGAKGARGGGRDVRLRSQTQRLCAYRPASRVPSRMRHSWARCAICPVRLSIVSCSGEGAGWRGRQRGGAGQVPQDTLTRAPTEARRAWSVPG